MIKFVKCTYDQYQYIWLKERVNNFLVERFQADSILSQLVDQFLALNQNQDREAVEKIMKEILKIN